MQGEEIVQRPQAWRWPLAGVVSATAIPILLFAALTAVLVVHHSRDNVEQRFAATARALVAAVDTYVLGQLSFARIVADLAGREASDGRDPSAVVRRFASDQRGAWLAVVISGNDGAEERVAFEAQPGTALPLMDPAAIHAVATQGAQTLEPMVRAGDEVPVSYFALRTPIMTEGRVTGVLSIALAPTEISAIAQRQQVSADALVSVFDRGLYIVGRSTPTAFIGHRASPFVEGDLAGGHHGVFVNSTLEGERYLWAFEESPVTGWHVAVGASEASLTAGMRRTILEVAVAGVLALLVSVVGALATATHLGRRIISRERQMSAAVRVSEARYRAVVEASQQLVWTCRADGSAFEDSPTWRGYTGQTFTQMRGLGWLEAIHPEDREAALARWRTSQVADRPYEAEYRLLHRASGRYRWVLVRARPVRGDDGQVISWIGMSIDIDERKTIEERQQLLMREVDHRAKNVLTVVQAIVQMTRADDIDGFVAAVVGRITALVRAHSLLASNRWEGTSLRRLVEAALLPFAGDKATSRRRGGRIAIDGAEMLIAPEGVQPLAMLLHEFATNAAKYGSLSRGSGSVAVAWTVTAKGGLRLTWRETGGPPVAPPLQAGFGSTLVRNLAQRQLEGTIFFEWHPRGLRCTLELPPSCMAAAPVRTAETVTERPGSPDRPQGRVKVLVVEDDVLVALSLKRTLSDLGYTVIGPAVNLKEASALAQTWPADIALLDVNIQGETVLPFAESLAAAGHAIVFCSGYGSLPGRTGTLADVPAVGKPPAPAELARALSEALKRRDAAERGGAIHDAQVIAIAGTGG